jgi:hypothetical protein
MADCGWQIADRGLRIGLAQAAVHCAIMWDVRSIWTEAEAEA